MTTAQCVARLYRTRRDEWLSENGPCVRCGSWKQLEIDHKNPEEKSPRLGGASKRATSHIWLWKKEDREAELAKCQVLCNSCHKQKNIEDYEKAFPQVHGTWQSYFRKSNPCRCDACVLAMQIYMRPVQKLYRARLKALSVGR